MAASSLAWSPAHWGRGGADVIRSVARWWLKEFLALFPAAVADSLMDRGSKRLVLSGDEDTGMVIVELQTERGRMLASTRIPQADFAPDLIDEFLRSQRLGRRDVAMGLRVPPECIFARQLLLPRQVERTLGTVLTQDLLGKTPFREEHIFHDHVVHRLGDKLDVRQWIVKRHFINDAVKALGLQADDIAFVEAGVQGEDSRPCIRLQRATATRDRWIPRAFAILVISACALAILAVSLRYYRQQQALAGLAAELAVTRTKAQRVRAALDKLESERASLLRLRAQKNGPGVLDVWEEVTRVLPAHSWLTEMRLSGPPGSEEQQLTIAGLSPAAATLVGLFDRSPLFREAALTASISLDPTEGKERFAIQAKLRNVDPLRTAAR
jgi:general secretion pathway protein L